MKLYKILLTTLVALFLTSCIDDMVPDDSSCSKHQNSKGNLYLTLSFNINTNQKTVSRTYGLDDPDEDYERKITDLRVFLADRNNSSAPVYEIKDVTMKDATTTEPILVDNAMRQGYLLFVVANPPSGFNPNLSNLEAFVGSYTLGSSENECSEIWQPNHFMMVNVNNHLEDYKFNPDAHYGGVPLEIDGSNDYGIDSPFRISVTLDRVAAKIVIDTRNASFDFSDFNDNSANGVFTDVKIDGVALINCANSFNLIQKWEKGSFWKKHWDDQVRSSTTASRTATETGPYGYPFLWCVTPNNERDYKGNYDPYTAYYKLGREKIFYNGLDEYMNIIPQSVNPDDYNTYPGQYELAAGAANKFKTLNLDGTQTFYCLENNSPVYIDLLQNYDRANDNFAVLPSRNLDTANPAPEFNGTDMSKLCSATQMRALTTGVLIRVRAKVKSDTHDNEGFKPDPEEGVWDTPSRAPFDGYATFYGWEGMIYTNLKAVENVSGLSFSGNSVADNRKKGLSVYENGYMYYIYWIKDSNHRFFVSGSDGANPDESAYHAVLRNTSYKISVQEIRRIGMDTPATDWYVNKSFLRCASTKHTPPGVFLSLPIFAWDDNYSVPYNEIIESDDFDIFTILYYIHPSLYSWNRPLFL